MFDDLARPEFRTTLEHSNASNKDIRDVIHKNFPRAVEQTKNFASRFKGNTARQTAHNVWKFLKEHITYSKDDEDSQIVRLPSRFVGSDCTGDCKSYSLTAASLLRNNGLPVSFRYAGYNGNNIPTHVYTVTRDENGKEIIVDGVWKYFDSEKRPTLKFDESMDVYTLSGIDGIGKAKRRRKGGLFKKLLHAKKVAMFAVARRPFLTLVALNIFGFARKIYAMNQKRPGAVKKLWVDRLGGKYDKLMKSAKIGYNRWLKRHKRPTISGVDLISCCAGIGFPPAIAAYVAAASTIIPIFTSAFKKSGVKDEPGEATGDEANDTAQNLQSANPDAAQVIEGIESRHRLKRFVRRQRMMHSRNAGRPGMTGIGKAKKKKKGGFLKKVFKGVKKASMAPNRRAFRTLVAANAGGIALKLARIHNSSDRADLQKKWQKIGGKYKDLVTSIKAGMKRVPAKKRIAISAAAKSNASGWAALAASIMKLFSSLFKKHERKDDAGNPLPGESTFEQIMEVGEKAARAAGEPTESADELVEEGKIDPAAEEDDEPSTAGFSLSGNGLMIGGGLLAAVVLFSGKSK